jgi:hypothetical protein
MPMATIAEHEAVDGMLEDRRVAGGEDDLQDIRPRW